MKRVLILDTPSRFTRFGGEQRMAGLLYRGISKRFKTYYLGSETAYLKTDQNSFILPHVEGGKRSSLYDSTLVRMVYYLVHIRGLRYLKDYIGKIDEWLDRIKPEVIIENSVQDYRLSSLITKRFPKAKRIYIDHGSISTLDKGSVLDKHNIPLSIGTGLSGLSLDRIKRNFFESFDLCVGLNMEQYRAIKEYTDKAAYIPNGIEKPISVNERQRKRIMERYGIGSGDFVVLNIGRMFERQKNVSTLIKAFMRTKEDKMKLVLVGTGPDQAYYKSLAASDGRIIFLGTLSEEELSAMYYVSSLFVLPSIWEGFPLTLLEAANHGVPIILSTNTYFDDFKRRGIKIDTFDPYSEAQISKMIVSYFESQKKRVSATKESVKISRAFSLDSMMKKYVAQMEKL